MSGTSDLQRGVWEMPLMPQRMKPPPPPASLLADFFKFLKQVQLPLLLSTLPSLQFRHLPSLPIPLPISSKDLPAAAAILS